jgi:inhibitor of cysteine peptidase
VARGEEAGEVCRLALSIALACGVACAGTSAREADRAWVEGLAAVSQIRVETHRAPPFSVFVVVHGELPDACTRLDRVKQEQRASGIEVTLTTRREPGEVCAPEATPFDTRVTLAIEGLPDGLYFVTVNGVQGTFEITEDLLAPDRFERYRRF